MMIAARPEQPAPRRVLIIKPSSLGDVVTAVPVLRGLRRSFPRARLSWMLSSGCAEIIAEDRDLDEVVLFDRGRLGAAWRSPAAAMELGRFLAALAKGGYDWVLDLQGLLRSGIFAAATRAPVRAGFADAREGAAVFYTHRIRPNGLHTVDRNIELARQLGIDARAGDMSLDVTPAGRAFAEDFRSRHGLADGEFLICVPPTRWVTKRYPVRHWRTVITALARKVKVVLLGAPGDEELCDSAARGAGAGAINLAGQTGVAEMVAVIACSAGVICSDSAAKFIAPAVGVPVVVLVGPTRIERTGPYAGGAAIVAPVPCQGCLKKRCRHIACMELIDPGEVIAAADGMLARRNTQCHTDS